MNSFDEILELTKQLYPDGRAFKFHEGNDMDILHRAMAKSEARVWDDCMDILNSMLPDNDGFTADDATQWERRLGIASGGDAVPLADRMAAIRRKLNHPGTVKARQSYLYVEAQLRAAGFDVRVYENKFSDGGGGFEAISPAQLLGSAYGPAVYGVPQYGQTNYGGYNAGVTKCVNYLEEEKDENFDVGATYRATFFISGDAVAAFADVPEARREAFRQLILFLKPQQMCAFLLVNYV